MSGYQGAAAHTWTPGCDGSHPIAELCASSAIDIDTANDQFVGATGYGRITVTRPKPVMTRAEALRHAAWLVAVADPAGVEFERVLKAVRGT